MTREALKAYGFALRVFIYQEKEGENEWWIAQGLEYDMVAQGSTLREVMKAFERTIASQIMFDVQNGKIPFEDVEAAPTEFWDAYREAERIDREVSELSLPAIEGIPPSFMIDPVAKRGRLKAQAAQEAQMAYPFIRMKNFTEFRDDLQKNFGCQWEITQGLLGNPGQVGYFIRKTKEETLSCHLSINDADKMSPSLIRYICRKLKINIKEMPGFELG